MPACLETVQQEQQGLLEALLELGSDREPQRCEELLGMDSCAGTACLTQRRASTDMLTVDNDSCRVQWMTRVGGSLGVVPMLCPISFHAKVCSICPHVVGSYDGAGMKVLAYDLPACQQQDDCDTLATYFLSTCQKKDCWLRAIMD